MTDKCPEHYAREVYIMLDGLREAADESDAFGQDYTAKVEAVMNVVDQLIDRAEEVESDA